MFTRDDILERLLEPLVTLTPQEIEAAATLARTDPEVSEALRLCRALSGLPEEAVIGEPRTSDAAFLVALRERLSPSASVAAVPAFGTPRLAAVISSVCVLLLVAIFGADLGANSAANGNGETLPLVAEALESPALVSVDSLAAVPGDPDLFAAYLGVSGLAENWDFGTSPDEPLTDALLQLDPQTLEEVLNRLEATQFF